jgi:predicted O-methyltransferase YrrM
MIPICPASAMMFKRMRMRKELAELLDELYARGREHDARQPERLDRLRNLEPDSARLLALLVRALAPRRLLELGTSNGYSTIWLADAARAVGGSLTSIEIDPHRTAQARENLLRAGLQDMVDLRVDDATSVLAASAAGAWDLVFLDAERPAYPGYWPELVRVLAPGGLLAVDNVTSHADELVEFRELVAGDERVTDALAPTGAGVLLVVREPE